MTDYFSAHESKSEWTKQTVAEDSRIQIVDTPVLKGSHAYRVELRHGDNPSGCRATLATGPTKGKLGGDVHLYRTGDEVYFGFSIYLPSESVVKVDKWRLFLQGKSADTGSPPFSINLKNGILMLNNRPNTSTGEKHIWTSNAEYDRYLRFVLHVKFSPDPSVGFLELYKDDVLVMPKKMTSTQHVVSGKVYDVFIAIGEYRDATITQTDVLYHDGFISAKTLEDAQQ